MRAVRKHVLDLLEQHKPKGWRVCSLDDGFDLNDRLTVIVQATAVRREPAAPMGAYDTTLTLTLVSPITGNIGKAEEQLDPALEQLLFVIEDHFGTAWDEATKVTFRDTYLAWNVPLHVSTSRKD